MDNLSDLFDGVSCHLTKVVLDFELSGVFLRSEGKMKIVFVMPL